MKKAIGVLVACLGLAAFAGSGGKATHADPKAAPAKEAKPAAVAATDGGTTTVDAGSPAKPSPKK
jgi:hypothetical protein